MKIYTMRIKFITSFIILLVGWQIQTTAQNPEPKMTKKEIKILVDSIDASLNRWYIYPDTAKLMAKAVKDNFKKGTYFKAKDKKELCTLIYNDIQQAHMDKHFRLMYDPEFAQRLIVTVPDSVQKKADEMMLQQVRDRNFSFVKTEILPGNIGYIRWDEFVGCMEEARPTFNSALQFVSNTRALIIDMRYNVGGFGGTVLAIQDYFFSQKTLMSYAISSQGKDTSKIFTTPSNTSFKLSMPIFILIGRGTFSAAEAFTYELKNAKRAILVGEKTSGGAHPTSPYYLGQGFVIGIPWGRSYNEVTKTDWEITGITPDVSAPAEEALSKAQITIYEDLLSKTKNDPEKNMLQWNLNVAQNKIILAKEIKSDSLNLSKETLLKFCGEYIQEIKSPGILPMSIILKGSHLYRIINTINEIRLTPISSTRFIYDDESGRYIDFLLEKDEKVFGAVISRSDGAFKFEKVK
jgi:hypothetical protein